MSHKRRGWWGLLFVAPALLALFVYFLLPIIYSGNLSFYKVELTGRSWVGLENYLALGEQDQLWNGIRVSAKFLSAYLFFNIVVAYLLAIGLSKLSPRFCGLMLTYYHIPCLVSAISSIAVWRWLYRYPGGGFNEVLDALHLPTIMFLGNPRIAVWAICFVMMGGMVGSSTVLYAATIGQVNKELLAVARLDGANEWQVIWYILTPLTQPVRIYILIANLIGAMNVWEHPFFFTGGGPFGSTRTMMFEIYYTAFVKHRFGLASALTMVMMGIALGIGAVSMRRIRSYLG